ncbi:hypothetical protein ABLN87_19400 [Ruegeria sp. SCPT10]|uniref:hypothetical protein n=1 Tax=Ruegeria sp. SCP10 TaxID=3141377 RepID=UPI003338BE58
MSWGEHSKPSGGLSLGSDEQDVMHFMLKLHQVLDDTTKALGRHLGRSFQGDVQYVPAALIFNPLVSDHALWINLGKGYGKTKTKDSLDLLKRFELWLRSCEFQELSNSRQKKIITRLPALSGPLFYFVSDAIRSKETGQLLSAVQLIIEHLEQCVASEIGRRGDYRAFRTAVALRAIFETYGDLSARSGDKHGAPTGPFCKCLEEIFEIGGITAGFRHYATEARDLPASDPLLIRFKRELIDGPARVAAQKRSSFTA